MSNDRIKCAICNAEVHSIELHLRDKHPEMSLSEYEATYPGWAILSETAQRMVEEQRRKRAAAAATTTAPTAEVSTAASAVPAIAPGSAATMRKALHEVFNLPQKVASNSKGNPIPVNVLVPDNPKLVPNIDDNYVYDPENLKNCLMALELNLPLYVWGHAGTGKTTLIEQIAARTGRMLLRVQHTVNTEESHIIGTWAARGGETVFDYGPLALAMKHGWTYLADEYDFALPSVLAVYQPVLEGKSLVIKENGAERIDPHPNFRFVATGNTNGSGDETGLYQGTSIQNAANYDRFHMVIEQKYMKPELEREVLMKQAGIAAADADKLVDFGKKVRESYDGGKISTPISPRTLIAVADIGLRKSSFRAGVTLCFAGKLTRVDREVVDGLAQRIFGS